MKIDDSDKSTRMEIQLSRRSLVSRHVSRSDQRISRRTRLLLYAVIQEKRSLYLSMRFNSKTAEILSRMQQDMYNRAKEFLNSHIDTATTMDEMNEKFKANRGFVKAMWCGDEACEDEIKASDRRSYIKMYSGR